MNATEKTFQNGISALNQRKLAEAEQLFREVLRSEPSHVPALNLLTVALMSADRFVEAEPVIAKAISLGHGSDVSYYNFGLILKRLNKPTQALQQFGEALRINPTVPETWNNRGTIFNDLMQYEDAIFDFDQAILLNPNYSEALANKGKSLVGLRRYDEASVEYDKALALAPDLAEAWLGRGNVFTELKTFDQAFAAYDKALALKPELAEAWLGRGRILAELKRFDQALADCDKALALKPELAEPWLACGNVFSELKRFDQAFAAYDKALALKPQLAEARLGRGNVFTELKRFDWAFADYDKALALKPELAEAWLGRGNVFAELKCFDQGFAAYDKALAFKPELAEAWLGRGRILAKLKRFDQAFAAYDKVLALKPDLAEAWLGRGNLFTELKRFDQAFGAYDKALALKPELAEAWLGRGNIYIYLKQYDNSLTAYDRALSLKPDLEYAHGARLHVKMHLCDWAKIEEDVVPVLSAVREQKLVNAPFVLLSIPTSPDDQLQSAKSFVADEGSFSALWRGEIYSHKRIRVAYISADLRNHAVAYLTAGLFEHHDRSRFEITGISVGSADNSPFRIRLESAFEHFIDAGDKTQAEIANLIRNRDIDIAVDLMGHTQNSQLGVLGRRPAPIQIHYLGYPGTTGASYVDYIIGDPVVIPEEQRVFYSEKVVYLPECFQANDDKRQITARSFSREDCGLPRQGFVFCSFNNNYKINPELFDCWMRILRRVDGSVLWLSENDLSAVSNLRKEAAARNVNPDRLIFARKEKLLGDHLSRHRVADLFLDTLPYGAHTTASDALWAGLPVLTCLGETFAGRVAASLLQAIGLPELITTSLQDYEALAIKLTRDLAYLAEIKAKLAQNRESYPLFDTARFTRHIEAAYVTMWERYQRGETPEAFTVAPID